MNIINNYNSNQNMVAPNREMTPEHKAGVKAQKGGYKPDFIDKISEKVVNKRDINDMVSVPRAIFKGYFFFTIGNIINGIAGKIRRNGIAQDINIIGNIFAIIGTYNFVKPFLIKGKELTKDEK